MAGLPFTGRADVVHGLGNVQRAALPCSLWPLPSPRSTSSGEVYDWTGEAPRDAYEDLRKQNRALVDADGRYLVIVSATPNDFLPHVALQLRETRPGG
jgi:hypothetical protein